MPLLMQATVSRTGFPLQTLQCVRFLLASDAEAAGGPASFASPGSEAAESRLAQVLVKVCESELEALGAQGFLRVGLPA